MFIRIWNFEIVFIIQFLRKGTCFKFSKLFNLVTSKVAVSITQEHRADIYIFLRQSHAVNSKSMLFSAFAVYLFVLLFIYSYIISIKKNNINCFLEDRDQASIIWGWRIVFFLTAALSAVCLSLWSVFMKDSVIDELNSPFQKGGLKQNIDLVDCRA